MTLGSAWPPHSGAVVTLLAGARMAVGPTGMEPPPRTGGRARDGALVDLRFSCSSRFLICVRLLRVGRDGWFG